MSLNIENACNGEVEQLCGARASSGVWRANKRYCNNDSLDSGIAGIKDPHSDNKNDQESLNSGYIVDPSTRTTYMQGKFLGKGGFARVHELVELTTNTVYACKIIPKNRITKKHHMQKIAREILIHRDLVHKNVVRLHHFFEDTVNAYIILENCSRKSLVHVLKYRRVVTEPEIRYFIHQLVAGVRYIHSQQVIHRDLKPGNMFLSENMIVKVGDFGLATQVDGDQRVTICGTPNYIAPEVLNKLSYSYEADVWAIGCIMYTLLEGQPPFETATLKETYSRIVSNTFTIPPLASDSAKSLICSLLKPAPQDRLKLDDICKHSFFTSNFIPRTLSTSCCFRAPTFHSNPLKYESGISQPPPIQDIMAVTNSVSTLKIFTPKSNNRISAKFIPTVQMAIDMEKEAREPAVPVSSLKQKLSSVLCPDKLALYRFKRVCNAATLYQALSGCFESMPSKCSSTTNPPLVNISPLFVSKWIDYSNKYGFGFQLSDKAVGVLFNDNTRISFNSDRSRVEFHDIHGKVTAHPVHSVPEPLQERLILLRYFSRYMDEHLTEGGKMKTNTDEPVAPSTEAGGTVPGGTVPGGMVPGGTVPAGTVPTNTVTVSSKSKGTVPHMKRWVRTHTAIIMQLCNGTLQVNFFKDHTKVIISAGRYGYLVTYINSDRQSSTYWLHHMACTGCTGPIYDRLQFATAVLLEFADLDGEEI